MIEQHFISTKTLCVQYDIELSFVNELNQMGLVDLQVIEQKQFVHQDQIGDFEKIVRLHKDLNLNLEGIDIVLNLLQKERELRNEILTLRNRLGIYESDSL